MSNMKRTNRLMLVATFIACVFISSMNITVGKVIAYPGLRPDLPCDHHQYPSACAPSKQPVNPYRRGCEKLNRCRRDPPPPISRKMLIRAQFIYNNAYNQSP
ncbi:Rapid ALkalinization Factor [Arabidopsis thaliana x Arabidopsis arenosa]|uniref:Rapid ALkalinization Factor n=1 Tax=Arabidopsis thaliana x Arabidopsis arenosa TaxID=1240361 RepID=A0A8T2APV6_9BRAS|nr:Rapid ALkalinization Factor [Arabidopsis thaliana x Arabidopsis arenosa]